MAAAFAGDGDVWLAGLPDACAAGGWTHIGFTAGADEAPKLPGDVYTVPTGNSARQGGVSLCPLGVGSLEPLSECEEYPDSFVGYAPGVVDHLVSPLGLGKSGRVYKSWVDIMRVERGRAARLARGAHNPKVGSSNLPPATTYYPLNFRGDSQGTLEH